MCSTHSMVIYLVTVKQFFFVLFFGCPVAYRVSRPEIRPEPQLWSKLQLWQCRSLTHWARLEIELTPPQRPELLQSDSYPLAPQEELPCANLEYTPSCICLNNLLGGMSSDCSIKTAEVDASGLPLLPLLAPAENCTRKKELEPSYLPV